MRTLCMSRSLPADVTAGAPSRELARAVRQQVEPLLEQNLMADIAMWAPRLREQKRGKLSARALLAWAKGPEGFAVNNGARKLVMIQGGMLSLPLERKSPAGYVNGCPRPCDHNMQALVAYLRVWVAQGSGGGYPPWPSGLYLLNTNDAPVCGDTSDCPMPVLSVIKAVSSKRASPDILVPPLHDMEHPLYQFPWQLKEPKAVFRGTGYCSLTFAAHSPGICSRIYLANLTSTELKGAGSDPQARRLAASRGSTAAGRAGSSSSSLNPLPIDVGVIKDAVKLPRSGSASIQFAPGRGPLPLASLARFKAVLSVEGMTASTRIAKLLHMNSAVLKQASNNIEWFYRSLVEGQHLVTFWNTSRDDVLQVAGRLLDGSPKSEARLQRLAAEGQAFALRYLSREARKAYWHAALGQYRGMFDRAEMEQLVQQLAAKAASSGGKATGPAGGASSGAARGLARRAASGRHG